jgi:hypothetical protein
MQATNGRLYGTASDGSGTAASGTVYRVTNGLGAFVSLVQTSGNVGQMIGILGQGFTGTTSVTFGTVSASFTVVSGTYLKATVPTGATTGFVTLDTPSGKLTSNVQFQVQ